MINVKRYNPDAAMSISREHAWMRETPEGGHVEYGDYASLFAQLELVKAERDAQQKRADALAVENAALNKYLDDVCDAYENGQSDLLSEAIDKAINLPSPATDAALAAIQAQAIEDAVKKVLFVDTVASTVVISQLLRAYAAALREAK